jgi:hypothetical protein
MYHHAYSEPQQTTSCVTERNNNNIIWRDRFEWLMPLSTIFQLYDSGVVVLKILKTYFKHVLCNSSNP